MKLKDLKQLNKTEIIELVLKILGVTLGFIYFWHILCRDAFSVNVYTMQEIAPNPAGRAILAIIRFIFSVAVGISIVASFFNKIKTVNRFVRFIVPISLILNLIFFKDLMISYLGKGVSDGPSTYFQVPAFIIVNVLMLLISGLTWFNLFFKKENHYEFEKKQFAKDVGLVLVLFLCAGLLFAPLNTYLALYGPLGERALNFTFSHRFLLYLTVLLPFVLMFIFKNKPQEVRHFVCLIIALSCFYGYFMPYNFGTYISIFTALGKGEVTSAYNNFPLHLCNAALIIMLIAFIFKNKPCFYFNYLVNILGASFALLMPDAESDLFYASSIHFWQNHIWVVALPLLARGLDLFPRPKVKYVVWAAVTFSIYFVFTATVDTLLGYDDLHGIGANYFFLNSDKYASMLNGANGIRNYIWDFNGKIVYWLYWLVIYIVYIAMMFGVWFLFTFGYKISDSHMELAKTLKKKALNQKLLLERNDKIEKGETVDMIKIEHLTKRYGKDQRKAVDDLTLEIMPGDIFGFLGHNGAGKSTLIKCLIGAHPITEGSISIYGHDVSKEPLLTKQLIGYVPDNHATYEGLTGREYINYIANLYLVSTEDRIARLDKYAGLFHIKDALDKPIKSYSHGMKQKITIIASLIHEPKVWILDEPLTGLDPTSIYQIKECMKEHAKKGNIVFFSSHVIDVVENVCTKVGVISHGKLIYQNSIKNIKKEGSVEGIYLKYVTSTESL